jgi:hypothetical protein
MEKSHESNSTERPSFDSSTKGDSAVPLLQGSKMGDCHEYDQIEGLAMLKPTRRRSRIKHVTSPLLSSIATAIFMLFLWLFVEKHRGLRKPQNYIYDAKYTDELQLDTVTCGETLSEAMARGCTFDPLADVWRSQTLDVQWH